MTHEERIKQIVEVAYDRLCGKVRGQRTQVDNEASLQLQLASILKTLGELYEESPSERFNIELEKSVKLTGGKFVKSGTEKAAYSGEFEHPFRTNVNTGFSSHCFGWFLPQVFTLGQLSVVFASTRP